MDIFPRLWWFFAKSSSGKPFPALFGESTKKQLLKYYWDKLQINDDS